MNRELLIEVLLKLGEQVCRRVHRSLQQQSLEKRTSIYAERGEDTIYQIDHDVEKGILPFLEQYAAKVGGFVLVAEGIADTDGKPVVLPQGTREENAKWKIIMDPIDGTRGIMYNKRSAFFLAGAAPNRGDQTDLLDIEIATMTELPTSRSNLSDTFWAVKGNGTHGFTLDLRTGFRVPRKPRPSQSPTIYGGFAQLSRFFSPGRDIVAAVEETMISELFPEAPEGKAIIFEDQYISSGGQLYEILKGHDRFVADIRTVLFAQMKQDGKKTGHVCHPYDLCTVLVGKEAGVLITDLQGQELNAPLDTSSAVDWVAYANADIRKEVEGALQNSLKRFGLI